MMGLVPPAVAAERLGTTERHLRSLRERGELPYVLVGKLVKYDPAALDRYIAERTVGGRVTA